MLWVRFQGKTYLFLGNRLAEDGPLATLHQYHHGECSYAHLYTDGTVRRFGKVIGQRADITLIRRANRAKVHKGLTVEALFKVLSGWRKPKGE